MIQLHEANHRGEKIMSSKLKCTIVCSATALSFALSMSLASAAEKVSSESIINALTPKKPLTRSLSMSPAEQAKEAETKKFVDSLRNRRTRSLSSNEREQIATIAQDKPRIDLEIKFEFNSAEISRSALGEMDQLGKALSDPALKGSTIALAGHTDASGSEDVNQSLSERRADAVKEYLVDKFHLSPENLVTAGYGKTRLKDKDHPRAPENRRVEIVNMADK
jgi:outer membrane protein OmpA-like peptidoglycan-associated protein